MTIPRILIVAGSDSGGGAGIQADIKTVTMLGGHAMTAVTAITAQNTLGVQAVHPVPVDIVVAQMRSVIDDIGVDAVKIGMIGSAAIAHAVADVLEGLTSPAAATPAQAGAQSGAAAASLGPLATGPRPAPGWFGEGGRALVPIVFDPVMIATGGAVLADDATIAAFARLMKLATLVTPNLPELAALGGGAAVRAHGPALLVKGGHATGDTIEDRLVTDAGDTVWTHPRIDTRHTHGTGCTLASGIAAGLGAGMPLGDACGRAIDYVQAALAAAPGLGAGHGPMGHMLADIPFYHLLAAHDPDGWDAASFAARWS
ncbi:bifunctional hydroxymethylpyrimidine kinase/phosphomethylpyrimidine kinase [Sphingomonas sp. 1P08PE]|uniref:bifunctional hydroxymethylpyrimidine kinase/phosphomethylpyrimidine kinase n=1 Tax=Sphingomonas sp. 1P08PE TaxID=554122 RepID=UPI0039A22F55